MKLLRVQSSGTYQAYSSCEPSIKCGQGVTNFLISSSRGLQTASCSPRLGRAEFPLDKDSAWRVWGPYLSERHWGTVREDYSFTGNCWEYFPFDHAGSRAYMSGEDGLMGFCDNQGLLCVAIAMTNGKDPFLKERLFGLSSPEGNHGEDVKEMYYHSNGTPCHSAMGALYRYPQKPFPYQQLRDENVSRSSTDPEFEILDTGVFDGGDYWDVEVQFAKLSPLNMVCRYTFTNRSADPAELWALPQVWFRNTWSGDSNKSGIPRITRRGRQEVELTHPCLGRYKMRFLDATGGGLHNVRSSPEILFTDNETNDELFYGGETTTTTSALKPTKDLFNAYIMALAKGKTVPFPSSGTKCAGCYHLKVPPGGAAVVRWQMSHDTALEGSDWLSSDQVDWVIEERFKWADQSYEKLLPEGLTVEEASIVRQAFAGLLWNKQFYLYDVKKSLQRKEKFPPVLPLSSPDTSRISAQEECNGVISHHSSKGAKRASSPLTVPQMQADAKETVIQTQLAVMRNKPRDGFKTGCSTERATENIDQKETVIQSKLTVTSHDSSHDSSKVVSSREREDTDKTKAVIQTKSTVSSNKPNTVLNSSLDSSKIVFPTQTENTDQRVTVVQTKSTPASNEPHTDSDPVHGSSKIVFSAETEIYSGKGQQSCDISTESSESTETSSVVQQCERNVEWESLQNHDVISMPDKWEFPWYAAWDLAFHMIPFCRIDPEFAKQQLQLFLTERYMHPSGKIPAYEFDLSDMNPPVHAWGCWEVYARTGRKDVTFLRGCYHKLLINYTWWLNQRQSELRFLFGGGFLGMDNISVIDRSNGVPAGCHLFQADGTGWMAFYSLSMLKISIELAQSDPLYTDLIPRFLGDFLRVCKALNETVEMGGLWDEVDGFFYDVLQCDDEYQPIRVRSLVGVIPMLASCVLNIKDLQDIVTEGDQNVLEFLKSKMEENAQFVQIHGDLVYLSAIDATKHQKVLSYLSDTEEFLCPFGIRSLSKYYEDNPYSLEIDQTTYSMEFCPGESTSDMFGGNSNWRGPVWFPINFLILEALKTAHRFYGDSFTWNSGIESLTMEKFASSLRKRLISIFLPDSTGSRPCHGGQVHYSQEEGWTDKVLFYEYFHSETGRGCGASHQTGWTALIIDLILDSYRT